jgi:hypothetical protein
MLQNISGVYKQKNPLSPPRQEILKIINAVNEITNITACTSEISKGYLIGFIFTSALKISCRMPISL